MQDKKQIQTLFSSISNYYDRLNRLFSLGTDHFWRQLAVAKMPDQGPYLDLCAGTLELSLSLLKYQKARECITAVDFCPAMLMKGRKKLADHRTWQDRIKMLAGDGEHLPLRENIFQGVMIGFGLRNLMNREAGLKEIWRVLRPGGRLVILEFSNPKAPFFRQLYYLYLTRILTPIGNLFSRECPAYDHLKNSVLAFPDQDQLAAMMRSTGFVNIRYLSLTFGIVALHWGEKPVKKMIKNGPE